VSYSHELSPPKDAFSRGTLFFDTSRTVCARGEGGCGGGGDGEVRGRYVKVMMVGGGRGALGLREVKIEGSACWVCEVVSNLLFM
jgi:hypothetical protein